MLRPARKLGLKRRSLISTAPHWSTFATLRKQAIAPLSCDNYANMPIDSSLLGNDAWGDCSCAATYREVEILTYRTTGTEISPTTDLALGLYSAITGFDPKAGPSGSNPTDQGALLQDVLSYRLSTGVLLPDGSRSKLLAFFEIDPRNINDVRLAIANGGVVQLGINCYDNFQDVVQGGTWFPPAPEDVVEGGHAICSGRYDQDGFTIKSWGMDIHVPLATWRAIVTECYAVVSAEWVTRTGKTPFGLTVPELTAIMQGLAP